MAERTPSRSRLRAILVRRWKELAVLAALAAGSYVALAVVMPACFLTVGPGPAPDVATLVVSETDSSAREGASAGQSGEVSGPDEPEERRGRFLLTTVMAAPATPLELWRAVSSPLVDLVPRGELVPAGMDDPTYQAWGRATMAESQLAAAEQAWAYLGHPIAARSEGVRVFLVTRDSPAHGRLRRGDIITSWSLAEGSGRAVLATGFESAVREAFGAHPGGGSAVLRLDVRREGTRVGVAVVLADADMDLWPFLGLALGAEGPRTEPRVPVAFPPGDIGGPSGGLMLSLGIIDLFTPGDLTGGRVVAGSGTMGPGGRVGAVGGLDKKMRAAARDGATVFLVPGQGYGEALVAAADQHLEGLRVVPVTSLTEACQALVSLTAQRGPDYNGADLPPAPAEQGFWAAVGR